MCPQLVHYHQPLYDSYYLQTNIGYIQLDVKCQYYINKLWFIEKYNMYKGKSSLFEWHSPPTTSLPTYVLTYLSSYCTFLRSAAIDTFPSICRISSSAVRASKKVQLSRIGSRPRAFKRAIDEVRTLSLSPLKGGSRSKFVIFVNKNQFESNKLCYKI